MADSPWDKTELWRVIRRAVVPHFEPIEASTKKEWAES